MLYEVEGIKSPQAPIQFAPPDIVHEVLQNVRTLLMTMKYSVPLDRELGINATFIDRPAQDAMMRIKTRLPQEIERYEPRAKVRVVEFRESVDEALRGAFYPVLKVEVLET